MGFFGSLFNGLINIICGGPPSSPIPTPHARPDEYTPPTVPHKPPTQARPPQSYPPTSERPPHSPPAGRKPFQRVDQNQVNQNNEHYVSLRKRANDAGDQMAQCFERSHQAYANGNGALAKELSNEGKRHQQEMDKLNKEASEWIFVENNKDSNPNEVDLHGLYVKEAITYTDRAIQDARQRGESEIHLIVGKGLHSRGGVAKLKPAIEDLIQKHSLVAQLDPNNTGVLIVTLDGPHKGAGKVMNPDDIARGIESREEGCTIM
ncbi:hypothetical protein BXZ70DRAFT_913025 [Cristinia sonorae]|uniref:Smr domain-containing protein n=1 Tax=Cristinia sonorae TaxID=1940300 RepID=A0A8K0UYF9_9AGAR|nr:hypothetical protein BXZ70DRAFT_913025 [Cristinia sonorae]